MLSSVFKCLMSCSCFTAATSRPFDHFPGPAPHCCAIQFVSRQHTPDNIGTVHFGITPSSYSFSCLYFLPVHKQRRCSFWLCLRAQIREYGLHSILNTDSKCTLVTYSVRTLYMVALMQATDFSLLSLDYLHFPLTKLEPTSSTTEG